MNKLFKIPRGNVYQKLSDQLYDLFKLIFHSSNNNKLINNFEKKFAKIIGSKHSQAFPLARTAIYCALKIKNFDKSSEIIMSPITIKPILDVVLFLGLKPVFVDLDPKTLNYDKSSHCWFWKNWAFES